MWFKVFYVIKVGIGKSKIALKEYCDNSKCLAAYDDIDFWLVLLNCLPILVNSVHFIQLTNYSKFNKSEGQYKKSKFQLTQSYTEIEFFNGVQKVEKQNFGACEDLLMFH